MRSPEDCWREKDGNIVGGIGRIPDQSSERGPNAWAGHRECLQLCYTTTVACAEPV